MIMASAESRHQASTFDPRQTLLQDIDMSMSIFTPSSLSYPLSYLDTSLGYDRNAAGDLRPNPFYSNAPPAQFFIPPSFTHTQGIPEVREARNAVIGISGSPTIKAEEVSWGKDAPVFHSILAHKPQTPVAGHDVAFGTDVDTLVRAIQKKSAIKHHRVRNLLTYHCNGPTSSDSDASFKRNSKALDLGRSMQASRKKYQCSMPTCTKTFFQKTHLEIHLRAHTGCKPFVSNICLRLNRRADAYQIYL